MALQAPGADAAEWPHGAPASSETRAPADPNCMAASPANEADGHLAHGQRGHAYWPLAIGSLGVVFGDIGTSPLYAFQAAIGQATRDPISEGAVVGVVSLALWALILVVTVKYVLFVMRADNKGEGGVLSLMALAQRALGRRTRAVFLLGLVGTALFYGDSIITPAITVLGAFQGMQDVPALQHIVTPREITLLSFVFLVGLFLIQSRGTAKLATLFGPVMVVWFIAIAALGV